MGTNIAASQPLTEVRGIPGGFFKKKLIRMKKFITLVQILALAVIFIPWLHVSSADNYTLPGEDYTNVAFPPDARRMEPISRMGPLSWNTPASGC